MRSNQPRIYVMPVVRENPPSSSPSVPQTQRDLVRASLLIRPPKRTPPTH
jgi:hypothetical protein